MLKMELKPGEGGQDAIDLVRIQEKIYINFLNRRKVPYRKIKDDPHHIIYEIDNGQWSGLLLGESGGHRWQRVPPTEKRGRVHTSTVKVAVYEVGDFSIVFNDKDFEWYTTKDSGPGVNTSLPNNC